MVVPGTNVFMTVKPPEPLYGMVASYQAVRAYDSQGTDDPRDQNAALDVPEHGGMVSSYLHGRLCLRGTAGALGYDLLLSYLAGLFATRHSHARRDKAIYAIALPGDAFLSASDIH